MAKQKLTKKQEEVLNFLATSVSQHGYPPTMREIGDHFSFRSTGTTRDYLKALQQKGYIRRTSKSARGIELLQPVQQILGLTRRIPVLGTVAAGTPILAVENVETTLEIDRTFFAGSDEVFGLRVKGESMIDAGIRDGDYVFVRRQQGAEDGEIVAVLVNDEATVKRFYREHDRIRLQPDNSSMEPIYISAGEELVVLLGKVVGIFREY